MEEKKPPVKEQLITLNNRTNLTVGGTIKIVSLKPDLIQLETVMGGLVIIGENLELTKLDNASNNAEITGKVISLKFVQGKDKEPLFRKIFK